MYDFLASFTNTNGVAFPNTAAVNSSGGGATDGTEFVKIFVDDLWGILQAVLNYTGDTPNGSSEVGASQFLDSIIKIASNITELSSSTTHTVEEFDKFSNLILSAGCTVARIVGGTGANETNKVLVQNNNTVTVEIDFGAAVNQDEIIMQPGQWIELVYDSEATKFIFQRSNIEIIFDKTASFTIADWAPSKTNYIITHGAATKMVVGTLPTLADNIGKIFNFKISGNGIFKLDGEGAETIEGKAGQYCFSSGDYISVIGTTSEWKILKHNMSLETGGFNSNDQTNRHYGNVVITFDNLAGTFEVGEIVKEYSDAPHTTPTGRYGTIIAKTASTLTLIFADGVGTFTNNLFLLGQNSGATADVNGNSKNFDANLYHLSEYFAKDFQISMWVTAATTFDQATSFLVITNNNSTSGWSLTEVGTAQFKIQTGSDSLRYLDDNGSIVAMTTSDYAFNIYVTRRI